MGRGRKMMRRKRRRGAASRRRHSSVLPPHMAPFPSAAFSTWLVVVVAPLALAAQ
jgi:hypothetical protein